MASVSLSTAVSNRICGRFFNSAASPTNANASVCSEFLFIIFIYYICISFKRYHLIHWQDTISRPIALTSSVASVDNTTRTRRQVTNLFRYILKKVFCGQSL
jgi:hypothetical protein